MITADQAKELTRANCEMDKELAQVEALITVSAKKGNASVYATKIYDRLDYHKRDVLTKRLESFGYTVEEQTGDMRDPYHEWLVSWR